MRVSRWVARAPRTTRAAVAGGLLGAWALVLTLLLAASLTLPVPAGLAGAAAVAGLMGLLTFVADAPGRRSAARRVGWSGSPDYYALVRVDADHGVLPNVEPARELAYRYARLSWGRRRVSRSLALLVVMVQLGASVVFGVLGGWSSAGPIFGYLSLAALFAYQAVVVLPRHRQVIRLVEGS